MSTDAQFKKGDIVRYRNGDGAAVLASIEKVAEKNPAEYNVRLYDGTETVCGESETENGAVFAL